MSADSDILVAMLEHLIDVATRPLVNDLETGFRHHSLSDKEKLERYKDNFEYVRSQLNWVLDKYNNGVVSPNG
jgi:hypothetical protein